MTATLLSDLIEHQIGGGWGADEASTLTPDPAFVIRGTDIPSALVGDVSGVPFRYHKSSNLRSRALQHLDIVFEVSGGSKGQPVGRALLVTNRLLEQFDESPAMCASFCKLIRLSAEHCDPRFVFRLLQAAYSDGSLDAFQVQSTGITNFRWKPFLNQYQVLLPTLRTQNQVAEVLGAIDELIENNRRRVEVLEEMARAIYREWFVHFRFPGHENATFVDSDLGPIPEGWDIGTVGDVLRLQRGFDLPTKSRSLGDVPIIAASGRNGSHHVAKVDGPGVVTGRSGTVGRVQYVHGDFWPLNTTLWVKEFKQSAPLHAWFFLEGLELSRFAGGAAVPTLNRNVVHAEKTAVAPLWIVEQFESVAGPLISLGRTATLAAEHVGAIRDRLLPKLVTGQIDVSDLDLDALLEGASV